MNTTDFMKALKEINPDNIKDNPELMYFYEFIQATKNISISFIDLIGEKGEKITELKKQIKLGEDNPWLPEIPSFRAAKSLIDVQETVQKLTARERDEAINALMGLYNYIIKKKEEELEKKSKDKKKESLKRPLDEEDFREALDDEDKIG